MVFNQDLLWPTMQFSYTFHSLSTNHVFDTAITATQGASSKETTNHLLHCKQSIDIRLTENDWLNQTSEIQNNSSTIDEVYWMQHQSSSNIDRWPTYLQVTAKGIVMHRCAYVTMYPAQCAETENSWAALAASPRRHVVALPSRRCATCVWPCCAALQ